MATAKKKKVPAKKESLVSRHDVIADIVAKYPGADEVLMDFGVGCFSCHIAEFETLEQGILGHGFFEEELEEILEQLNEIAKESAKKEKK